MAADGQVTSRRQPPVTSRREPAVTVIRLDQAAADRHPHSRPVKPTLAGLGVDLAALDWQRSGADEGSFEVAFVAAGRGEEPGQDGAAGRRGDADWILLRVAGDPGGRVLVYDRTEWMCFIDGAGRGEFDLPEELIRAGQRIRALGRPAAGLVP